MTGGAHTEGIAALQPAKEATKPTIWAAHCPFRKTGSPVLGTMGSTIRPVVVIPMETWTALCKEIAELGRKEFNVGAFED